MIASIEGTVTSIGTDFLVVKNNGLGFKVHVPKSYLSAVEIYQKVELMTYLLVREDALTLFGFENAQDRDLFVTILGANGVGPKTALSIISTLSIDMIRQAVATEQPEVFSHVPGVGKKTAQSLLLHLQGKIPTAGIEVLSGAKENDLEVIEALTALGYSVVEAQAALQMIPKDAPKDLESRIKLALQYFA